MRRNVPYYVMMVAGLLFVLEVISFLAVRVTTGQWFTYTLAAKARAAVLESTAQPYQVQAQGRLNPQQPHVLHPYLGFVWGGRYNEHGFKGAPPPMYQPEGDSLVVAVVGGSVAYGQAGEAGRALKALIEQTSRYRGRPVRLVNLALPGMKQPQQLMAVQYFLTLGAHFDVVINLDGFNEVVLPVTGNIAYQTNPFYPRGWRADVKGLGEASYLRGVARIVGLEDTRLRLTQMVSAFPFRVLVTANLLWYHYDRYLWRKTEQARQLLTKTAFRASNPAHPNRSRPHVLGPWRRYEDTQHLYTDLAAYWRRSSVLLAGLARSQGIDYYHFLQPNQYVAGSKVFSAAERAIALPEGHPYQQAARTGYPYLIEAGKTLPAEGVRYYDLTMLFKETAEPVYMDGCCHFNERGKSLINKAIAGAIDTSGTE